MKTNSPKYLRVSLLSACNLRCRYCMPEGPRKPTVVASMASVLTAIRFLHQTGINKIRFTGGEPTLFKRLPEVIAAVTDMDPGVHTAITTNGVRLPDLASELGAAGLRSVNISLDTLDENRFRAIAGRGDLRQVLDGIDAAVEHIPLVKLNCVMMRGTNDDEAATLIEFANERGVDIRFIEFMPNASSAPGDPRYISGAETRRRLQWTLEPQVPRGSSAAQYYVHDGLRIRVGFIDPVSHPFCDACDRLRLTAQGDLYACLFETGAVNLFDLLDRDASVAWDAVQTLLDNKRFGGCTGALQGGVTLPSFTTLGG